MTSSPTDTSLAERLKQSLISRGVPSDKADSFSRQLTGCASIHITQARNERLWETDWLIHCSNKSTRRIT